MSGLLKSLFLPSSLKNHPHPASHAPRVPYLCSRGRCGLEASGARTLEAGGAGRGREEVGEAGPPPWQAGAGRDVAVGPTLTRPRAHAQLGGPPSCGAVGARPSCLT